jgi:hypothetical protein
MIEPTWKLLPLDPIQTTQVVFRQWEDGRQESCLVTAEEYVKWLEAGNTPISSDE